MTTPAATKYELVIGMEVHAHVLTRSKMFCGCSAEYSRSATNTHVCPVCLGMPGVLPVINQRAVELTIMTGLALHCAIPEIAKFDRKNYPYPDLMKGYQISQYELPLCKDGWLEVELDGRTKRIGITRVHLEEDTARSMHRVDQAGEGYSLIDVNRSGTPLMEIVSEPDIRSAEEARLYAMKLQQTLRYLGASRANMEDGDMRCEPNASLRPIGRAEFGSKVELKNLNSFRAIQLGVEYEVERQSKLLDAGERVAHETRGWRDELGQTVSQRSKEVAEEYRYFPEPDLPPIAIRREYVDELRGRLPELPDDKRRRFLAEYGLSDYEANLLIATRARADYFETAAAPARGDDERLRRRAKSLANWLLGDFARLLNAEGIEVSESKVAPADLHELIVLIEEGTVSTTGAKGVFEEMYRAGKAARAVVQEQGLTQISEADELTSVVDSVLAQHPKPVADFRAGKEEALKFLVGQVMRETRGRAKPDLAHQLVRDALAKLG